MGRVCKRCVCTRVESVFCVWRIQGLRQFCVKNTCAFSSLLKSSQRRLAGRRWRRCHHHRFSSSCLEVYQTIINRNGEWKQNKNNEIENDGNRAHHFRNFSMRISWSSSIRHVLMIQESENDYILFIADIDFEYQVR